MFFEDGFIILIIIVLIPCTLYYKLGISKSVSVYTIYHQPHIGVYLCPTYIYIIVLQFKYITAGISLNYVNAIVDNIIITTAACTYICVIYIGVRV